jgi:acetyltransferase-like isoleucine patch superfamily enzyme
MKSIFIWANWLINRLHGINIRSTSVVKLPYKIWNPQLLTIGNDVFISENAYFAISNYYRGHSYCPKVTIGDRTCIGGRFFLASCNSISIGSDVMISENVFVTDHDHSYKELSKPIMNQNLVSKGPVVIGDGSFIGINSVILSGVKIGKHVFVGASSVVTKDIPSYSVAAGNPAMIIKKLHNKYHEKG